MSDPPWGGERRAKLPRNMSPIATSRQPNERRRNDSKEYVLPTKTTTLPGNTTLRHSLREYTTNEIDFETSFTPPSIQPLTFVHESYLQNYRGRGGENFRRHSTNFRASTTPDLKVKSRSTARRLFSSFTSQFSRTCMYTNVSKQTGVMRATEGGNTMDIRDHNPGRVYRASNSLD